MTWDNKRIKLDFAAHCPHCPASKAGNIDHFRQYSFSNVEQQWQSNIEPNSSRYHPSEQRQISSDKTPSSALGTSSNQTASTSTPSTITHLSIHHRLPISTITALSDVQQVSNC